MEGLYALKLKEIWRQFWSEHFSFWMICGYLFIEYVRPQSIIPALDFLPWAQVFILFAAVGMFFDPKRKWVSDSANKWMILFFFVILLSSWNAYRPDISYQRLSFFYTWLVIYFLIINIVNTRERFFIFLAIFVIASFKISFSLALTWAKRGLSFTTWGLQGPPGFFQNSGELAIQMAMFFPIAYVIVVQLKPYVSRSIFYILMLMPVTAAMTILGASSRGGQLALAMQLLLMFYRQIFRPKALIGIVIVVSLFVMLVPVEQKQRFESAGTDKTSQQRLNYWEGGVEMLNDHPILGVGYFNFAPYFEVHYPDKVLYQHAQLPHNILVQVGSELGYLGLFVYAMLIKNGFMNRRRSQVQKLDGDLIDALPFAFNISFIGFLVAGEFVSVVYYPFMWIQIACVVCLRNILGSERQRSSIARKNEKDMVSLHDLKRPTL